MNGSGKILTIMLCCLLSIQASAFDRVHTPALALDAGDSLCYQLPASPDQLTINFRISCPRVRNVNGETIPLWTFFWNHTGSDSYTCAEVSRGNTVYGSPADEEYISIEVYRMDHGKRTGISTTRHTKGISTGKGANSIDLDLHNGRLYLRIGNGNRYTDVCDMPYTPATTASACGVVAHTGINIRRERVSASSESIHKRISADITEIDRYFKSDNNLDPVEGYWYYHDRNIVPMKATLGGFYNLAIIRSDSLPDTFDIIYISGASTASDEWCPGRIKGQLHRTGLLNEFDLLWLDSEGRPVAIENSATVSDDGSLLMMNFPMLESAIRFRRNVNQLLDAHPE